jgi:hypothetical protein
MIDTPRHIKELQLKLWLSKSPMERLKQTLESNGQLLQFWSSARLVDGSHKKQITESHKLPDSQLDQ